MCHIMWWRRKYWYGLYEVGDAMTFGKVIFYLICMFSCPVKKIFSVIFALWAQENSSLLL